MTTLTEVKERPILFSTPMVKAIIENRKRVARRVIKPQPVPCNHECYVDADWKNEPTKWEAFDDHPDEWYCSYCGNGVDYGGNGMKCPYGKPGDVLWVRETWAIEKYFNGLTEECFPIYRADYGDEPVAWNWKPSIHMPRAACRLRLEIVSITVERLQDITEEDAKREGCRPVEYEDYWEGYFKQDDGSLYHASKGLGSDPPPPDMINPTKVSVKSLNKTAKQSFETLWQSINGPDSWNANPWVWRIFFRKL